MPRRNCVDPWGDLYAATGRGLFTGNRGCLVDDRENVVRHHGSSLWITCKTEFRGWRWPLARPKRWTPIFFLDEAVALAAAHRPCAFCRRDEYNAYRESIGRALGLSRRLLATDLNIRLSAERYRRGRGLSRAGDRLLWTTDYAELPDGVVVIDCEGAPRLKTREWLLRFSFDGWCEPTPLPRGEPATVLTPPTSVAALRGGYRPTLHTSAMGPG